PCLRGAVSDFDAGPRMKFDGDHAPRFSSFMIGDSGSPNNAHEAAVAALLGAIRARLPEFEIIAVGHRVVHGGLRFSAPVVIDDAALVALDGLVALAPDHMPHNLAAIRTAMRIWPDAKQIACFDTQFHRTQPRLAQLYALPRALSEEGIVRYGFHGLSYEYIADVLPDLVGVKADGRVIVAHLGAGASMCAMKNRRSVATSMGYTALDGLMMATRCGDLDPGVVLHLIGERGIAAGEVMDLLHKKSGLLGVSGISGDMRHLEESDDPRAEEALALYAYRANRELGSLIAALGGLDVFVFTGGVGEHSAQMRRRICDLASWTGVELDAEANESHAPRISSAVSAVDVLVVKTNEELVLARSARRLA
ncbi:MAG: acetate/propionate family kinase, partial [Methylocystis sp.]|nr:acetate/propionate family kinase [Methylocystis sp.]